MPVVLPDSLFDQSTAAVHLIGCGGAGMRALAEVGRDRGWDVSGSDAAADPRTATKLAQLGVEVANGHRSEHVGANLDAVIHSPAVPVTNPERMAAVARGIPDWSYPQVLGAISRRWPTIAVAGTHGKSTTTALVAEALTAAGSAAVVCCGAELLSRGRHGWSGAGSWGVVEACEFRSHFLELTPAISIVLSIEPDHFDCFPRIEDSSAAYRAFVERTRSDGVALISLDTPPARELAREFRGSVRMETLSTVDERADWFAGNIRQQGDRLHCTIHYRGVSEAELSVPLLGVHHAANVVAAWAAARSAGVAAPAVAGSLVSFGGLGRRLERHPDWRGVVRFDDYAHHPTAVAAILRTLRDRQRSQGRLVCAFQPHQINRTEELLDGFADALGLADEVWVLPVYAAREGGEERARRLSQKLAEMVAPQAHPRFVASLDHALLTGETALRPGDTFLTLGAGDIHCLQYDIARRFP